MLVKILCKLVAGLVGDGKSLSLGVMEYLFGRASWLGRSLFNTYHYTTS